MAVKINKNTWLNLADYLLADDDAVSGDVSFWDTPDFQELIPQDQDVFVEVDQRYVGRLDLVAWDYYRDPDLWWVIALANNIDLIPTDVRLGMSLRIPVKTYVDSFITKGGRII
jgi:hypothetical protein